MKKFSIFLLVLLIITLSGYGLKQGSCNANSTAFQEKVYLSNLSDTDCYLCGGGIENLIPEYWGQNNVALISVNTFDIKPLPFVDTPEYLAIPSILPFRLYCLHLYNKFDQIVFYQLKVYRVEHHLFHST